MRFMHGLAMWFLAGGIAAAAPNVVVSILPLYHIVEAVMGKVGKPVLLVPEGSSEHAYALKPSQYAALASADVVLWVGPALETYLVDPLASVPQTKQIVLINEPTMIRYNVREVGEVASGKAQVDPHLWLDAFNAMTVAKQLEKRLSLLDPEHTKIFQRNAAAFIAKISALNTALEQKLESVQSVPYLVYHDAFQYFEKRYGLKRLDSIVMNPHVPVSAARWIEVSHLLKSEHIPCIFSEPQNQTSTLKQFASKDGVKLGVLNPMGAEKPAGTDGYAALLTGIADGLLGCLK
jgi:zinc transport system substrate-binding protein